MKKILLVLAVLLTAAPGMGLQAAPDKGKTPPDWVLNHDKEQAKGRRVKRAKPPRKIAGTAKKGAPKVSPLVVKKKNP